jgi:hypothetical protein
MRATAAIVLALAIGALVTWYRERPPKGNEASDISPGLTSKQGEKCDYKEAIHRFDAHPCWLADDPIK